jgi:toluene monooxygenase electron transfer component
MQEIAPLDVEMVCHNAVSDVDLAKQGDWEGPCCFIHELVKEKLGDAMPDYEFYFCGPPPMTEAVQRLVMIDYKVPFHQVHFARFF